jgi:hypothetical protein
VVAYSEVSPVALGDEERSSVPQAASVPAITTVRFHINNFFMGTPVEG